MLLKDLGYSHDYFNHQTGVDFQHTYFLNHGVVSINFTLYNLKEATLSASERIRKTCGELKKYVEFKPTDTSCKNMLKLILWTRSWVLSQSNLQKRIMSCTLLQIITKDIEKRHIQIYRLHALLL